MPDAKGTTGPVMVSDGTGTFGGLEEEGETNRS
jgi:hypothetical protein